MLLCLEGPTGAGKSTLYEKFPDYFKRCPEICSFLGGFPSCGKTEKEIEQNTILYLKGEIDATKLIRSEPGTWIQDRNWFSQLTFLMAIQLYCKIPVDKPVHYISDAIRRDMLIIPDLYIYLHCCPSLTKYRRSLRDATMWGDVPSWIREHKKKGFRNTRYYSYEYLFSKLPLNFLKLNAEEKFNINNIIKRITRLKINHLDRNNLALSIQHIFHEK